MAQTWVRVVRLPQCDFGRDHLPAVPARFDAKTRMGPWANMCEFHFERYGLGLGTGLGQRLILEDEPIPEV